MPLTPPHSEGQAVTAEASGEQPVPVDLADENPATSQLATDIARLTTMTHEQLLAERAQAEAADATGDEGDDDRAYIAALEKRLAELDQAGELAASELAADIGRLKTMNREQLFVERDLTERVLAETADAADARDRVYLAALEKRIAELQTSGERPAPEGVPLYYRMTIPSGGIVCARVAGEGDPVQLTIPDVGYMSRNVLESEIWSLGNTGTIRVQVPRDVAWALWAALSDALMPGTDALPDWALELIEPTDEQGQPLPGLPAQWPF